MIRKALLVAAAILATSARADVLRLTTPAGGSVLRGGHFYTLSWEAQSLPPGAEEWEAFASVDGGGYYCARLTPHLDIDIHRFEILVPNVDSDDFRLLIRTGDEHKETIVELPQRFRIRAEAPAQFGADRQAAGRSPESARPGDAPVALWTTGDRAGRAVHNEGAAVPPQVSPGAIDSHRDEATASVPRPAAHIVVLHSLAAPLGRPCRSTAHRIPATADVLLLSTRMNV